MSPGRRVLLLVLVLCGALLPSSPASGQDGPRDARFGAVEVFWDPQAAAEAGVAWERILFYWSQLQPYGPEDWNTLHVPDEWLQIAQANGREVVGLLKNTPAWAAAGDVITEASPPRGLELPISDPGNLWANFVARAVAYYAPRGVHRWIIWNEPDIAPGVYGEEWGGSVEDYYRLLQVAYQVIKSTDPAAQVHLAGLTHWHDPGWLRRFLAVATADPEGAASGYYFDVVSLHIYFQTDSVDYVVNETRAALNAFGLSKPIWINETNASPDSDPLWPIVRPRFRVDLREQASFILQAHALALAAGAQRIAVYKLVDSGLPPGGEPFGLLRPDHSRRPAFTAYQLVTQYYAGTQSARVNRDPLWAQVTLNRGGVTTRVFWARTDQDVALHVPALAPEGVLVDQEGNARALSADAGVYSVALPGARCIDQYNGCFIGGPTYLLVEQAPAQDLGTPAPIVSPTLIPQPTDPLTGTRTIVTPTAELISPTATATATATPSLAPSPSSTRRATLTPSPTTAAPAATDPPPPSPTHQATPARAVVDIGSPTPSATSAPQPSPVESSGRTASWVGLLALASAVVLAAVALWRAHLR